MQIVQSSYRRQGFVSPAVRRQRSSSPASQVAQGPSRARRVYKTLVSCFRDTAIECDPDLLFGLAVVFTEQLR
jgi:hypothetical protein